jgi:hypothetical protein
MNILTLWDKTIGYDVILNDGEINEIIEDYLKREYVKPGDTFVSFNINDLRS